MLNTKELPSTSKNYPVLEVGAYPGRLIQVIDLGLQEQEDWEGEERPPKYEANVTYELSDEFLTDDDGNDIPDKPRWLSENFTLHSLSSERAKSTQRYYAIDPKEEHDGDWSNLLGLPCTVNIGINKRKKDGSEYNKVMSVSAMRTKEANNLPEPVNEPRLFSMDNPDVEVFNNLPDWMKDKIKGGLEFKGSKLEALLDGGDTKEEDTNEEDW